MIHKLITVVLILAGTVAEPEPWQHELQPGFAAPFDMLMLPWPEPAETQDMSACWRGGHQVPFLGAAYEFWCYRAPAGDVVSVYGTVRSALRDAGFVTMAEFPRSWLELRDDPALPRHHQVFFTPDDGPLEALQAWYFDHPDGVFLTFGVLPR